jgi:FdrA protein
VTAEVVRAQVFPDSYRDSVELMSIAAEVERAPGVLRAGLVMATEANLAVLETAGLRGAVADGAGSNDLVVALAATDVAAADAAIDHAARLLRGNIGEATGATAERAAAATIAEGLAEFRDANIALISTPGTYATAEALKALKRGLHVFLFSDNVSSADEIELKTLATGKGLLVMGPDCGTAIIDGVPLGFANAVRRGPIGLVAASGTGLQQVTCLIDQAGLGVSQAIGVGGHDLSEAVGGVMMLAGLARLQADPATRVIVLLSKPPAASVAKRILAAIGRGDRPVVVNFLGGDPEGVRAAGGHPARTLEEAAALAVALVHDGNASAVAPSDDAPELRGGDTRIRLQPTQRRIRGLYSGGTLAAEATVILEGVEGLDVDIVDLGDDEYTVGRPHPMIDSRLRADYIAAAGADPLTGVILLDIVLGYGSHPDPAGALVAALGEARAAAERDGRSIAIVASVCGTAADPQGLDHQAATLRAAGVLVARSNAQAVRLARAIALDALTRNGSDETDDGVGMRTSGSGARGTV